MRIKRLDISGFKSFCNPVSVVFDHAVTAVVGPNGCGKSNIVDAIRWAIGERSAKRLRGEAMEDVIFNGSESRGPQSMAEVTITFDNADGLSDAAYTDYPEISVSRRLHRDGTSEYLINKVPCRLQDIHDLLLGTGGGARAYSIIEQGRIGLIVSSRSEDRRSMIEEAAGITRYKEARRKAHQRMEQTRQNLLRINDRLGEMDRNLSSLSRQAKKAERYKRYKADLIDIDLYMSSHRYLELRATGMAVAHGLELENEAHTKEQDACAALEAGTAALRLEESASRSALDEKTRFGFEIGNEVQVHETEIKHLTDAVRRLLLEEASSAEQTALALKQQGELRDEATVLSEQLGRIERVSIVTTERYEHLAELAQEAKGNLSVLAEQFDVRRDQVSRARARLAASDSAVHNLESRIAEAGQRLENAKTERRNVEERLVAVGRSVSELEERTSTVLSKLEYARATGEREQEVFEQLKQEVEAYEDELRRVRDDLKAKASRKASLEEVMTNLQSHDRSVRDAVLMLENEAKELLEGLVIDTIECPERFEPALAAVLSDRLQALLVADRDTGMAVLAKLRERELGRVTVVSRTELPERAAAAMVDINDPSILGPLFSFLRIGESSRSLVEHLLSAVFVVDSAPSAVRLWRQYQGRATFVSLDGQLLEAGGAMRGGQTSSPGSDLLGQKRQIRELTVEVDKLEGRHFEVEGRLAALKEESRLRRESAEQARRDAQAHEIQLVSAKKDGSRAIDDLKAARQSWDSLQLEVARQEELKNRHLADHERAIAEKERTRGEIAALEKQILEESARIEAFQAEAERLSGQAADARVEKAALDQQRQSGIERGVQLERTLNELSRRLEQGRGRQTKLAEELGRAAGSVFGCREALAALLDRAEAARAAIEVARQEVEAATSRRAAAEEELKRRRAVMAEQTAEITRLQLEEREARLSVEHLLASVRERDDVDLLGRLGDYHMLPVPGDEARVKLAELKEVIERMGEVNLTAIEEYERESTRHEELRAQKADLEQALEDLERAISKMDKDSRRRFKETFEDVNKRFQETFPRLFHGGHAHMVLTDPNNLLETGVDIVAQPPGKHLGNIELLSGGEKALTAVSLLFAIFLHRPSPFCVLDEVDAPLDEANIARFIDMVKKMTDRSQFIIITHSKLTMERSDALYGVTMEEPGISKLVSVRLTSAPAAMAANA